MFAATGRSCGTGGSTATRGLRADSLTSAAYDENASGPMSISRIARISGIFILDAIGVFVATAIVESPLHPIFLVHSATGVLRREVILSVLCAGLIGFLAFWKWQSATSKMVWVLFLLIFGLGILVYAVSLGRLLGPALRPNAALLWTGPAACRFGSSRFL